MMSLAAAQPGQQNWRPGEAGRPQWAQTECAVPLSAGGWARLVLIVSCGLVAKLAPGGEDRPVIAGACPGVMGLCVVIGLAPIGVCQVPGGCARHGHDTNHPDTAPTVNIG
jgi:hypothetical protein